MCPDIEFRNEGDELHLDYRPQLSTHWIVEKVKRSEQIGLSVFRFEPSEIRSPILDTQAEDEQHEFATFTFAFGSAVGEYFQIRGDRLSIPQSVFFHRSILPVEKQFVAPRKVSIFKQIARITEEDVYIGGSHPYAVPLETFDSLVAQMPTKLELEKYVLARCSSVLREHLAHARDAQADYERYRSRREVSRASRLAPEFREYEIDKFTRIQAKLEEMLSRAEEYPEGRWQEEILDPLLLIMPKYVRAFREAPILDQEVGTDRSVDFLLMDFNGNVDVLEIKKPIASAVVTPGTYRDNHVPMRTLSGTVMQVEKYLYHLVRSGEKGLGRLRRRFGSQLPEGTDLKVTNPQGLVLVGRDHQLTDRQRLDFEVIRRHYKNVVDVLTYDDLLRRLGSLLRALESEES